MHKSDGAVVFDIVCIWRPLVVQDHGGIQACFQTGSDFVVTGQDLLQTHGAFRSPPNYGVTADIYSTTNMSGAECQKRPAVQYQTFRTVVLHQPFQNTAIHLTKFVHRDHFPLAMGTGRGQMSLCLMRTQIKRQIQSCLCGVLRCVLLRALLPQAVISPFMNGLQTHAPYKARCVTMEMTSSTSSIH